MEVVVASYRNWDLENLQIAVGRRMLAEIGGEKQSYTNSPHPLRLSLLRNIPPAKGGKKLFFFS